MNENLNALLTLPNDNYRYSDICNLFFYFPLKNYGSFLLQKELKEDRQKERIINSNSEIKYKRGGTLFWVGIEEIVIVNSVYQHLSGDGDVELNNRFPYILADWLLRTVGQGMSNEFQTPEGILPYHDYLMKNFNPSSKQLQNQYKDFGF